MTSIQFVPVQLPATANAGRLSGFGKEVIGVDVTRITPDEFSVIEKALYEHDFLLFRNTIITPEQHYQIVKRFHPGADSHGHGAKKFEEKVEDDEKSPFFGIRKIPAVPQVLLIGNGLVKNHEGILEAVLQHPSHKSFHRSHVSDEDDAAGYTRFYHWHMDGALYDFNPPKITGLYAITVPQGPPQIARYEDGSGDELAVSLGTTAFIRGTTAFDILPKELKSVAVRSKIRYPPHPFLWMNPARAMSNALTMETEGLETPYDKLPPWEEGKIKTLPMVWKNPVTGGLHLEIAGTAAAEILIDALPPDADREGALYPDGAHLTDLKEVRDLVVRLMRPGIAPSLIYPHVW
ncbi:Clavaminate synthase-like protein [Phlebopus sp. FC_14]|nr:Clavaminate synthase-like protein [Phlebopus sp. FC_14]